VRFEGSCCFSLEQSIAGADRTLNFIDDSTQVIIQRTGRNFDSGACGAAIMERVGR
jgi:hypothetical protein